MIPLSNWITGITKTAQSLVLEEEVKSAEAWRRISEKPVSAVFRTAGGVKLPPQIVRLESDNRSSTIVSAAGAAPIMQLIIYGIVNHISLPDTDMKEGYTFVYNKDEYHCIDTIITMGEIQGVWEASG